MKEYKAVGHFECWQAQLTVEIYLDSRCLLHMAHTRRPLCTYQKVALPKMFVRIPIYLTS